jgi:hypothetical protein
MRSIDHRNSHTHQAFNITNGSRLLRKCDGYRTALRACSTGSTDSVNVVFGILGHIVVDNQRDVLDIDSSGGDVGGYEHSILTVFKSLKGKSSLSKRSIRVNFGCRVSIVTDRFSNFSRAVASSCENKYRTFVAVKQFLKRGLFLFERHDHQFLMDRIGCRAGL